MAMVGVFMAAAGVLSIYAPPAAMLHSQNRVHTATEFM